MYDTKTSKRHWYSDSTNNIESVQSSPQTIKVDSTQPQTFLVQKWNTLGAAIGYSSGKNNSNLNTPPTQTTENEKSFHNI